MASSRYLENYLVNIGTELLQSEADIWRWQKKVSDLEQEVRDNPGDEKRVIDLDLQLRDVKSEVWLMQEHLWGKTLMLLQTLQDKYDDYKYVHTVHCVHKCVRQ